MTAPDQEAGEAPGPVWLEREGSPYVGQGADVYVVVETEDGAAVRLVRAVGPFDTLDRAEQWAEDNLGGTYAVIPFEIAPGSAADDTASADPETGT